MSSAIPSDQQQPVASNDPHHTYPQVAQKIIETLNGLLHPEEHADTNGAATDVSPADLEIILDMIQVNLTFDDPGIFFSCPTPLARSRQMQRSFNRWLHHQIVYIVGRFQSETLRKKAAELQLEMLQASLLKQRWLFAEIVTRYAELLSDLCRPGTIDWDGGLPHRLWSPAGTDDDGSPLSAPNHSRLEVTSFAQRDTLATNCVHLLTAAVALCANMDASLVDGCAAAALLAFGALGLVGKTAALQFFTKLLRRKRSASGARDERQLLQRMVPQLLHGIQQTRNQLPVWLRVNCAVRARDVKRFAATVGYLLGQVKELPAYCTGEHNYAVCRQMCTFLLTTGGGGGDAGAAAEEDVRAYFEGKFAIAVIDFFGRVLRLNAVRLRRDLGPLFGKGAGTMRGGWQPGGLEADVVGLLQCSVRDRLQRQESVESRRCGADGDGDEAIELDGEGDAAVGGGDCDGDGDEVFRLVDELADWALRGETMSDSLFVDKLRLLNTLITMLLAAEHEFQLWHQDQHQPPSSDNRPPQLPLSGEQPTLADTCTICTSAEMLADDLSSDQLRQTHRRMRSTIVALSTRFLDLLSLATDCLSSADSVFELADIGWRLFGCRHSRQLQPAQQQQLLGLAMCTLMLPPADSEPHHWSAAIQAIVRKASTADRLIFHEHLVHTILATDLHRLEPALAQSVVQQFAAVGPDAWSAPDAANCWQHLWLQIDLPGSALIAASVASWTPDAERHCAMVAQLLGPIVCIWAGSGWSVVTQPETRRSLLRCERCETMADESGEQSQTAPAYGLIQRRSRPQPSPPASLDQLTALLRLWLPAIFSAETPPPPSATARLLAAIDCLPALATHCPQAFCPAAISAVWLPVCRDPRAEVQHRWARAIAPALALIRQSRDISAADKRSIFEQLFVQLSEAVTESLTGLPLSANPRAERQAGVVRLLTAVGTHRGCAEVTVLQTFQLLLFYLVRSESECAKTAALGAYEMCRQFGCTLRTLVAWHRDRVFAGLTAAAVANCAQSGGLVGLHQTLSNFCHLLGYQNWHSTFMPHYCGALLAQLLPWRCERRAECDQLVEELCAAQNKSRAHVMQGQFLHVWLWVSLRVTAEAEREECVQYLLAASGMGLVQHLKADSRRTLNEVLVWYHRNPEFVMQTLRQLIGTASSTGNSSIPTTSAANSAAVAPPQPLSAIADYIAARFLGVLNYFGVVLVAHDLDKSLQAEMLLSLGEIIRFMGAAHITPFRFKILTVLRSVLAIENRPRLRAICAAVWKIFVYTVDVAAMGPLLSIVVVFLEPLMLTHPAVVDEMLRYLIIANSSLLSRHINDLFFVERTGCCAEVVEFVRQHSGREAHTFEQRFAQFAKQIAHENIDVRCYALQYLRDLLDANRPALNALIVGGQPSMSPLVEQLLGALLEGSRHEDAQLQLAAGRCLGRIGALEPSHLPPNYAPQKRSALGIHSDVFATMALAELCRAYQFQKDTKRVDGFSLAIQEILLARGVCPEAKKKMNVWNAIPERMRQLMQPLLKSCYTALPTGVQPAAHPIFSPGRFATAESWACAWATRLTDMVEDEDTKHLLKSFKTSLRNDGGVLAAFMPYIVLHAVQTCSAANALRIEEELHCVFRHVLAGGDDGGAGGSNISASDSTGAAAVSGVGSSSDELALKCAKIAFNQLEFLGSWLRQYGSVYANSADDAYRRVAQLLGRFDARLVAAANFRCGEFARALQYLEVYVEQQRAERLQPELSFLAQIYAELLDPDSLSGALQMKAEKPTLSEQVLLHTATGRLQDSTVCFEQMLQAGEMTDAGSVDMIQCYLGLDQPETALMVSEALQRRRYDRHVPPEVYACSAEPLWRLGRFEELDELLDAARLRAAPDWGVRCGQVLLALRRGDRAEFGAEVERCHGSVLRELRAHDGDEVGSYDKVYELVLRLHRIAEMEMCEEAVGQVVAGMLAAAADGEADSETRAVQTMLRLFEEWDARLELLRPTAKIIEPVLCLRRVLLTETKSLLGRRAPSAGANGATAIAARCSALINTYLGDSLMKSTELARCAEMYQQAQLFILNAESYAPAGLFIEKAKLAWSKGDQAASLSALERGIDQIRAELVAAGDKATASATVQSVYAEAKFLVATYNADAMNTNTALNIRYFKEAMQSAGESEKCYVYYAQYLEKVYAALTGAEQLGSRGNDSQQEIMTCYGKSMAYGCRYIYQSMPRFLSIWLDFTARPAGAASEAADSQRRVAQNMTKIVDHFAETLPPFVFFTAFSQLVSRICHPSAEVYAGLKTIIIRLIKTFTQQSMWMIMSVYKSSYASRVKRCTEIFSDRRLAARDLQKLINDFNLLAERMIELTNKPVGGAGGSGAGGAGAGAAEKLTVSGFYRELPALLRTPGFSPIILPTNKFMLPRLPAADQRDRPAAAFQAFPEQAVYIGGCRDELVVMPSLQKPKRIALCGTDGRDYMIMMKPKDDLRKDFRLMEFNAIVNRYLRQDAEARQRRLYIRTYAVLPLNEECGIIEWLPNLQALRPIVIELLKRKSLGVSSRELRELYRPARDAAAKRQLLIAILMPRHPPQLADWYKERFSSAHNWYLARSSYVRTTAVISLVGYILGLGDRHGENILFDTGNGDSVHVDFNCLFNKGESFEVPELVPFRLTHNMVHAMGALGVEGAYRQCAQITLRVLREQQATLMSVLRPFVYDPLVSWNRVMSKSDGRQERTDTQAITNVKRIEERLRGYVKQNGVMGTMALSSEGVVNHCIAEATDVDKLAAMYMGWGSFI